MALLKNKWHDDVNEVLASATCGNRTRSRTNGSASEARNLLGVLSETVHHNEECKPGPIGGMRQLKCQYCHKKCSTICKKCSVWDHNKKLWYGPAFCGPGTDRECFPKHLKEESPPKKKSKGKEN
ncbi:hypothetical protein RI054_16g75120 [Pseudoscourfieldia marina]